MVSFQADMGKDLLSSPGDSLLSMFQMPPFPEIVDHERPDNAAAMVLASISPRSASTIDSNGFGFRTFLDANGDAWNGGNFQNRMAYARNAMTLETILDAHNGNVFKAWHDSFPPLIPLPEHVVQPARQKLSGATTAYLLPEPPSLESLFPDSIPFELDLGLFLPSEATLVMDALDVEAPKITVSIPLAITKQILSPMLSDMDDLLNTVRTGSASAISAFARSPANIDVFSPKEVEVTLAYQFRLAIPSYIQLMPLVTIDALEGMGRAVLLEHPTYFTVRLQSTGGRRGLLSIFPKVIDIKGTFGTLLDFEVKEVKTKNKKTGKTTSQNKLKSKAELKTIDNTPFYFRIREKKKEKTEEEKKKEKDAAQKVADKKAADEEKKADADAADDKKQAEADAKKKQAEIDAQKKKDETKDMMKPSDTEKEPETDAAPVVEIPT